MYAHEKCLNILVILFDNPSACTGQAVIKALSLSGLKYKLFCVSSSPYIAGLYRSDHHAISPRSTDRNYVDWLLDYCKRNKIHVLFPDGGDFKHIVSHREVFMEHSHTHVIGNPKNMIDIADNKLLTCRWLEENGFAFPAYAPSSDKIQVDQLLASEGFPLFAKKIFGAGSIGCFAIYNTTDLRKAMGKEGYIVQKLIGTTDKEYTAACFVDRTGVHRGTILMRRLLHGGASHFCDVSNDPAILDVCKKIAVAICTRGTINIQLRIDRGIPVCFDINPRFSSTSGIRAHFGFNDVEHTIRHYFLGEQAVDLPVIIKGTALRYTEEIYIDKLSKFEG